MYSLLCLTTRAAAYRTTAAPEEGPQKAEKTNMVTGMIKYGTGANRRNKLSKEDLDYAAKHFDPELMSLFEYTLPPPIPEQ